jgi:hypothetical protein
MTGNFAGRDAAGRTLITLAVDAHLLQRLLALAAGAGDHYHNGESEPNNGAEEDRLPSSL